MSATFFTNGHCKYSSVVAHVTPLPLATSSMLFTRSDELFENGRVTSAYGTKRQSRRVVRSSADGGKADLALSVADTRC
jgi:hypothetical protein